MTTTWFYGPGVPPLPAPAPSDRPMSEEFRSEMARLAALFVRMKSEAERRRFAVAVFGSVRPEVAA